MNNSSWPVFCLSVFLVLFVSVSLSAQSGWQKTQLDEGTDLRAASFVEKDVGWVAGDNGTVFHTSDGGANWDKLDTGTDAILRDVHFVSKNIGWVAGGGYKTVREGKPEQGSGTDTVVMATGNGGKKWKDLNFRNPHRISGGKFSVFAIYMLDKKKGFLGTGLGPTHPDGDLFMTTDSGQSWNRPAKPRKPIFDIDFADGQNGIAVGYSEGFGNNGSVVRTSDGGSSWDLVQVETGRYFMVSVSYVTPKVAYAVGQDGRIFKTEDGGKSWSSQESGTGSFLWGVDFYNKDNGIAVGAGGTILITSDGGSTWKAPDTGFSKDLLSVEFAGDEGTHAYITGEKGLLLYKRE